MARRPPPAVPTLGELHREPPRWFWVYCTGAYCSHSRALPLAPFVIRYGADASSDVLRQKLTCARCGHRGATLQRPSWVDMEVGVEPFPAP